MRTSSKRFHVRRFIISIVLWGGAMNLMTALARMDQAAAASIALAVVYIFDKALEDRAVEHGIRLPKEKPCLL